MPISDKEGGIGAVLGIAFMDDREMSKEEIAALLKAASNLPFPKE